MRVRLILLSAGVTTLSQMAAVANADTGQPPLGNPVVTVLQLLLSLGLIVFLVVLLIRFLAKRWQVEQKGSIQVLAARQLAPNKSVQVVDIQGKKLLLGVGDNVTVLADVSDDFTSTPVETGITQDASFGRMLADKLQSLRERYKASQNERESS